MYNLFFNKYPSSNVFCFVRMSELNVFLFLFFFIQAKSSFEKGTHPKGDTKDHVALEYLSWPITFPAA